MSLGQIIRRRREELGFTLDEVSNVVGFSKPYLSTIENGKVKNPPSDELLRRLEQILRFDDGLLQHIAHMEKTPADIRRNYEESEAENQRWRQLIKNIIYHKSNSTEIDAILAENGQVARDVSSQQSPIKAGRLIPVINKISAGYPIDFDDFNYPAGVADDYVRCPDLHDPNAFAVRVIGDSMEPKFLEGDIVIFSPAVSVRNGDDCFIRFTMPHETTFKRVFFEAGDKIRLQPRNDHYSPMIVESGCINGIYRAIIKYEKL